MKKVSSRLRTLLPASAALALLLGACSGLDAPTVAPLEPPPDTWSDASKTGPVAEDSWWQSFSDPSLDALIREALANNRDLAAAATAVDAAVARARIDGAELKPQVSAGLNGSRRQQVFVGLPIPGSDGALKSLSTSWGASLDISWEADLWGRLRAGQKAALGEVAASAADLEAARLSLSGQTAKAWFSLVESQLQVRLAEDTVASRQRTFERTERRYRLGVASSVDLRLAQANQANAEANLENRLQLADAASRQLEVLLGRYPTGELEAAPALPPVPPEVATGRPAELVARRPDLRAASERLIASGWRLAEARRALYPRLSLSASGGTASDSLGDLLDGDFSVWSLAGGLLQPLFQGGRLRAGVELAAADRDGSLQRFAAAASRAYSEVETALHADARLAAQARALQTAAEQSAAAAELAEGRYARGIGEFLSVLDAQRQTFAAESQWLAVQRARLSRRVDLFLALGGGVDSPPAQDFSGSQHQSPLPADPDSAETVGAAFRR